MSTPEQELELELGTESVQAHARLLRFILVAVVATHLLLISTVWGQWKNIAIITGVFFFVAGFNMVLAKPIFSSRTQVAETLRLLVNTLANIIYGHFTAWALPVWLYLPLDGIWVDTHLAPRARLLLFGSFGVVGAVAVLEGCSPLVPLVFIVLSALAQAISSVRRDLLRRALERLEHHTRRQEQTNRELASALDGLRAAQTRLVQQEKLASLGRMTAGVAHEIKNPLNFVVNFAELNRELVRELRAELETAPERSVKDVLAASSGLLDDLYLNVEKIREHGARADGIVRAMLEHARSGTGGALESTNVNALVEEQLDLAYHGARVRDGSFACALRRELDPEAGPVRCAPREMGQVLQNLFANAFYAVGKRARETGDSNGAWQPAVVARTRRSGESVVIEVADNGAGISSEVAARMFEPFFTTKPPGEGTGLGLSLAYEIVRGHGGRLEAEQAPGGGALFRVVLPLVPTQEREQATA